MKHFGISPRKDECDPIAVLNESLHERHRLLTVWWVAPDAAEPWFDQSILTILWHIGNSSERVLRRTAWIQVEVPEWSHYPAGREPACLSIIRSRRVQE